MIKHIIAIYPGRFQPFGKHHAAAFKWLQKEFGQANAYIVTSDKVDPPKSPFSFEDKKDIITQYGFDHVIQVKNPYKAEELMKDFDPTDTAVVFMVGEKDMQEDPRFKIGTKKDGSPSYFQVYKDNKSNLQGFDKHGYLVTAPHVSINIPGYGEMSGTELRKVLGDKTISREEKSKVFKDIFGWYDAKIANNMMAKLEALNEHVFSKNWWKSIFEGIDEKTKNSITEENILTQIKSKFKVFLGKLKQENTETKKAFNLLIKAAKGDIKLTDKQKSEIGEQLKDTLKLAGLTAIAVAPGGIIVAALLKLLGQESLVTPSSFVNEVDGINIPQYLYHATYKPLLKKIKEKGLDTSDSKKAWDDSVSGYVYLALDPYVAESYAEESEMVPESWLDNIIILKIDTNKIDKSKLFVDQNVQDNEGDTLEYRGTIPWEALSLQTLNEIGEANALKYKWEEANNDTNFTIATFTTDKNTEYEVTLQRINWAILPKPGKEGRKLDTLEIGFSAKTEDAEEDSDVVVVNKKEMYRVMATITDIIKTYVIKYKVAAIAYAPAPKRNTEEFGTQRDKLYRAFITKAIPGVEIINDWGTVVAILPDTQINEVGEANLKPYKWEEVDREGYYVYTRFTTDSDTQYDVDLKSTNYIDDDLKNLRTIEIEFLAKPKGAEGGSAKIVVNKGELYKVMATITDIVKKYIKKSKAQAIIYSPSKKSNEENFGVQRDNLYKAFISKAFPGTKFEKIGNLILATLPGAVTEGYMGAEQTKKHNAKLDKLKNFLNANIGREFVYDFDTYPKTVVGVGIQEGVLKEGGAAGHMAHPFNIDWVKNGKDLLEVFKMAVEYLKNGPGAVKIDGLNASVRLIELDGKKQFVLDRGSQKDLDIKGITKDDLLGRFGEGHGMIKVGGEVLDIFNGALNETKPELVKLGLWDDPNVMFNVEYVSGTSNVIEYGNNFLAIHGLLEITRQTNAKTGKPGARTTTEIDYNESIMQSYIDKLGAVAQSKGYEVVGSVPTEMKSEPNFAKVLSEKITINSGNGDETKPLSAWLATIKVPENETIKLSDGKTVNALSKAVLNAVLAGTPLNEFVADPKDIPMAINGAITYLATAKLGDEVLKNLDSKLGTVSDHEGVVIRDEKIYDKPFKLTGQFIITGQTSQFQKNQ